MVVSQERKRNPKCVSGRVADRKLFRDLWGIVKNQSFRSCYTISRRKSPVTREPDCHDCEYLEATWNKIAPAKTRTQKYVMSKGKIYHIQNHKGPSLLNCPANAFSARTKKSLTLDTLMRIMRAINPAISITTTEKRSIITSGVNQRPNVVSLREW